MLRRRDILGLAGAGAAGLAAGFPSLARAQGGTEAFDPALIASFARALAKKPFKAPAIDLPEAFANLTYDQYAAIRTKPGTAVWLSETTGFAIEPLHRGFVFSAPMHVNLVENGVARQLIYDAGAFEFGAADFKPTKDDIGFSGFRVLQVRDNVEPQETAIFQGYSFFRAVARGQTMGTVARALAIRTADANGEELPVIRSVWIEKPSLASNALVIHALLDSESLTGAFRFTLRPGEATIIDTECTLFARATVGYFGLGAMQASALTGALDHRKFDDARPEAAEVSGLQMLTGKGEWLWRPVTNREALQISLFSDDNPKGFGLIQRRRSFEQFLDPDQHWEARPSLWIEPIGDWGAGAVQLIEIPSESELNDNIVAFWRPKQPLAAGTEQSFAYRQFWCWSPPERPALATVTLSRSGKSGKRRRFIVAFAGDILADLQRTADMRPMISAGPGAIAMTRGFLSRENKTFHVIFDLEPGSEPLCEIRLVLESGGKPISETWLYRWTP